MSSGNPNVAAQDTVVQQSTYIVPTFTVKELLDCIPAHCFKRSALRSSSYIVWDLTVIYATYKLATELTAFVYTQGLPRNVSVTLEFSIWALYTFIAGLFGTGIWIIAHECGHGAFSESKAVNNVVGWALHSALGVPYHSWRLSHAKHHASTSHLAHDQPYIPYTRSERGLKPLDPVHEDDLGSSVSDKVKKEMWEALGDSPIAAAWNSAVYLLVGWPAYLMVNASGQSRYPKGTNHFNPSSIIFSPQNFSQIIISDIGVALWVAAVAYGVSVYGWLTVFKVYFAPYLWVNHWIILITFLQHTDPLLPHYRAPAFTFIRGALSTLDRSLLGDLGSAMGWLGAHATHGISETHVLHHVCSRIPHYNAWEATDALRVKLAKSGLTLEGRPGGWSEMYRVYRECKFVEDEGNVVFYKNAYGLAQVKPSFVDASADDSGIDIKL